VGLKFLVLLLTLHLVGRMFYSFSSLGYMFTYFLSNCKTLEGMKFYSSSLNFIPNGFEVVLFFSHLYSWWDCSFTIIIFHLHTYSSGPKVLIFFFQLYTPGGGAVLLFFSQLYKWWALSFTVLLSTLQLEVLSFISQLYT
jgi:hypothetical protein